MSGIEAVFCRSYPWRIFAERAVLPWSVAGTEPAGRVLEVGTGSGATATALLRRYPDITLVAGDYDPAMVAAAADRLASAGDRASAVRVDATAIDFPDGAFDTVLSFLMLHHVLDWERALGEMVRVLKPGGRLIGYDLLSTRTTRLIHDVDRSPYRLIAPGEFERELARLPVRPDILDEGRLLVRFALTKSS
ncbi:class I SAM-dependent methyltransferase [Gordonia sp. (in: high G+C Gram-positive bacteria)]|uniref:class I SAM-dependent methyltransferase n=1 Tax=Gordonia sp. (in: high G+C Gram-positive bacteria) TaxID=84139 RepID=UPI0039E4DB64